MMKQHNITFDFQARYYQYGELNNKTRELLFVLHGYGQQARSFLRKFHELEKYGICIIAPEGLSRFYLKGHSGRVGATWMTKEERLTDIKNYIQYLNDVYDQIAPDPGIKITILGFSQGAATAIRWALNGHVNFKQLVLWGGIFPPDMDFDQAKTLLKEKSVKYVYGSEDPFLTPEKIEEMQDLCQKINLIPQITVYQGGHDIDQPTLKKMLIQ